MPFQPQHITGSKSLETRGQLCSLITQNIDDLDKKAGIERLIQFHGSMTRPGICLGCKPSVSLVDLKHSYHCICGQLIQPDLFFMDNVQQNLILIHV